MVFKAFRVRVLFRILLLTLTLFFLVYFLSQPEKIISGLILGLVVIFQVVDLFNYVETTNRKLTRFLESIKYSDFVSGFTTDNKLGKSFKELNRSFNEVMDAFREAREEKEVHLNYLHTVVQHIRTGILSYDPDGNVELINNSCRQLLQMPVLRNIEELKVKNNELYKILRNLPPGSKTMLRKDNETHLSIHAIDLRMRGRFLKLVSLQNIQAELQQKELEAWQNLTRVLRHEIMNSITPIASLTGTLNDIIKEDFVLREKDVFEIMNEGLDDLKEGLQTIQSRSQGLIRFVDAYRDYTTIPRPRFEIIKLRDLFENVNNLFRSEIKSSNIHYECTLESREMELSADRELIEMVLINLLKNAREAIDNRDEPKISLRAKFDEDRRILVEVKDNGSGIIPEAQERIFIPFYTTKKTGSGIGLALSRQIMQLHNGSLTVKSEPMVFTLFTLRF